MALQNASVDVAKNDSNIDPDMDYSKLCVLNNCIPFFVVLSIIAVLGIFGNILVIGTVAYRRQMRTVTFVSLSALALADLLFLASRYTRYVLTGYFPNDFSLNDYKSFRHVLDFITLSSAGASIVHVVLLSVLRYFIVVHPIKARIWFTVRTVLFVSATTWILCGANGGFYMYAVVINGKNDPILSKYTNIVITLMMTILPVILIITFHILKARKLLRSLSGTHTRTVKRMSRIITLVCGFFLVTTMPSNVQDIMIISGIYTNQPWFQIFSQICRVCLFLNFSINPYIYFLHSPRFISCLSKRRERKCSSYYSSTNTIRIHSTRFRHQEMSSLKSSPCSGRKHTHNYQ